MMRAIFYSSKRPITLPASSGLISVNQNPPDHLHHLHHLHSLNYLDLLFIKPLRTPFLDIRKNRRRHLHYCIIRRFLDGTVANADSSQSDSSLKRLYEDNIHLLADLKSLAAIKPDSDEYKYVYEDGPVQESLLFIQTVSKLMNSVDNNASIPNPFILNNNNIRQLYDELISYYLDPLHLPNVDWRLLNYLIHIHSNSLMNMNNGQMKDLDLRTIKIFIEEVERRVMVLMKYFNRSTRVENFRYSQVELSKIMLYLSKIILLFAEKKLLTIKLISEAEKIFNIILLNKNNQLFNSLIVLTPNIVHNVIASIACFQLNEYSSEFLIRLRMKLIDLIPRSEILPPPSSRRSSLSSPSYQYSLSNELLHWHSSPESFNDFIKIILALVDISRNCTGPNKHESDYILNLIGRVILKYIHRLDANTLSHFILIFRNSDDAYPAMEHKLIQFVHQGHMFTLEEIMMIIKASSSGWPRDSQLFQLLENQIVEQYYKNPSSFTFNVVYDLLASYTRSFDEKPHLRLFELSYHFFIHQLGPLSALNEVQLLSFFCNAFTLYHRDPSNSSSSSSLSNSSTRPIPHYSDSSLTPWDRPIDHLLFLVETELSSHTFGQSNGLKGFQMDVNVIISLLEVLHKGGFYESILFDKAEQYLLSRLKLSQSSTRITESDLLVYRWPLIIQLITRLQRYTSILYKEIEPVLLERSKLAQYESRDFRDDPIYEESEINAQIIISYATAGQMESKLFRAFEEFWQLYIGRLNNELFVNLLESYAKVYKYHAAKVPKSFLCLDNGGAMGYHSFGFSAHLLQIMKKEFTDRQKASYSPLSLEHVQTIQSLGLPFD